MYKAEMETQDICGGRNRANPGAASYQNSELSDPSCELEYELADPEASKL